MTPPPSRPPHEPLRVFLCSADEDTRFRGELEKHLAPFVERNLLRLWHPDMVPAGSDTDAQVHAEVDGSDVVLALTSVDLLFSGGLRAHIERAASRGTKIIHVLVRACEWKGSLLGRWQPVPETGKFIGSLKNADAAWSRATREILVRMLGKEKVESLLGKASLEEQGPRERWLRAMIDAAGKRGLLTGIGGGLGIELPAVRVPIRLARDREGKMPLPSLAEQLAQAPARFRMALAGEVGTGKSELLYETCGRLAERALQDPSAPIPVLVRARHIGKGLKAALRAQWPTYDDLFSALLSKRSRLILLVDGLDEAGKDVREHLLAEGERCHALVVASRPVVRLVDLFVDVQWLVRWSEEEARLFLARCAQHAPRACERLRDARLHVPPDLLENPLTASMCLLVAEHEPAALKSRAELFRAIVRRLIDEWCGDRGVQEARAEKVMAVLERLALEVVSRRLKTIPEGRLRKALGPHFPHRESDAIETAEARLGLLVRRHDKTFDFALRSLAEHLAGRALLGMGEAEIVSASRTAWGAEPVRHAIGLAAIEGPRGILPIPGHASTLVDAILRGEEGDDITEKNAHLRSVLAAVNTAADLAKMRPSTCERLAAAARRRLRNETSIWVGDRVAEATANWIRARPVRTRGLVEVLLSAVTEPASRASWWAAQANEEPSFWRERCRERDPDVRWVAIQRLAPFVDDPEAQRDLREMVRDDGMYGQAQPVAIAAGTALRAATRNPHFRWSMTYLRVLLERGDAFQQAGAAIALRPGEADIKKLAYGLCRALGGSGFGVPRDVLEEVAADPEGRAELERLMPDWRNKAERDAIEPLPPGSRPAEPPCSADVRQRLVRTVAPALRRAPEALLRKVKSAAHMTLPAVACELAHDFPEIVCALLDAAPEPPLSLYDESNLEMLSRAAVLHDSIRRSLLGYWHRIKQATSDRSGHWRADYPGRALDALVQAGNEEAQRAFAEWVVVGHHSIPFRSFGAALLDGFDCPPFLRDAGHSVAAHYFAQVDRVALSTIAEALFRLSSFWKHDMRMRRGVEAWLTAGEMGKFSAGIWALQRIGLTHEAQRRFGKDVKKLLAASDEPFFMLDFWQLLPLLDQMQLLRHLRELVDRLAKNPALALLAAPLAMPGKDPRRQRAMSQRVARSFQMMDYPAPYLVVRLVEAAPGTWAKRLEEMAVGVSSIGPLPVFLRALRPELQARVAKRWLSTAAEFPWVRDGRSTYCIRPADKIREVLFDLGVDEPPPPSRP